MNETMSDPIDELYRPPAPTVHGIHRDLVIFLAILGACLIGWGSYFRRSATCAICRMDRVDRAIIGLSWFNQNETECSQWYRDNVEPTHIHFWVRGPRCEVVGIPGFTWALGCSIGNPITYLSQNTQMEVYRHFDDRFEAKQIFLRGGQWNDDEGVDRLMKVSDWADRGFPGTWQEWLTTEEEKLVQLERK